MTKWLALVASSGALLLMTGAPACHSTGSLEFGGARGTCDGVGPSALALVAPSRGRAEPLEEATGKQRLRTLRGIRVTLPATEALDASVARRLTACRLRQSPPFVANADDLDSVVIRYRELGDEIEITIASEDLDVARRIVASEIHGG